MAKRRITHTTPYDRPRTLVSDTKDLGDFIPMGSPPVGAPNKGEVG